MLRDFTDPNDPLVCRWWKFWEEEAPMDILILLTEYIQSQKEINPVKKVEL